MPALKKDLYERLMALTEEPANGQDCWRWTGAKDRYGYARVTIYIPGKGSRKIMAHIAVYELVVGPVPEGMELDHLCTVEHCINPDHLQPVTHKENCIRRNARKD